VFWRCRFTENLKKHEAPGVKRKSRRREQEEKTRRIDEECILHFFSGSGMIEGTFYLFLFIFAGIHYLLSFSLSLSLFFSFFHCLSGMWVFWHQLGAVCS